MHSKIYWQISKNIHTLKHSIPLYTVYYTPSSYTSILKHLHSDITALEEVTGIIANFLSFSVTRILG